MRASICQLETDLDRPFAERVAHATDVVRRERDSDLVLLPELWPSGAFLVERLADDAQPLDGPLVGALAEAARAAEVWLHGGSFVERATDGRLFNTSVLLDPTGDLRAVYRKVHLFGFRGGETTVLSAGQQVVTCETPFGTVGLATCYDLRFPELFRAFVDRGVTLCLVPSAWPERRIAHWDLLARARAVEDQVVLLGANTVGRQGGTLLGGRSVAVDAWGEVLATAGAGAEEVLRVDVDLEEVDRVRVAFPVLPDRRL